MENITLETFRTFRLRAGGVECDEGGLRIASVALLTRDGRGWRPRPEGELSSALTRIYGVSIEVAPKMRGLAAVADALNRKDLAHAQTTTLMLKFPEPEIARNGDDSQKLYALFQAGWLVKDWDPAQHPRAGGPPNAGRFAPTDGSGSEEEFNASRLRDEAQAQQSPTVGRDDARIVLTAGAEEGDEKFPWEEREEDEEGAYFNPDTGKMTTTPPGVTLGPPWLKVPRLASPTYLQAPATQTWINPNSLDRHYIEHADEFGARDVEDYAAKANEFYLEAVSRGYRIKADSNGVEHIYDPKTNTFGTYTAHGRTITFFKPDERDYWDRQTGFVVKTRNISQVAKTERGQMDNPSRFMCPICGYPDLEYPPRTTSGNGSHEFCACCGFRFGYHDDDQHITYDEWRKRWVAKLMPWTARTIQPPPNWNPVEQLRQCGKLYRVSSYEEFKARHE